MKIVANNPIYTPSESVRTKRDGQGGAGQQQYEHQFKRQNREDAEKDPEQAQKQVAAAVESFGQDPQAQASGIQAALDLSGPGLRVVLKDCNGSVLRQLSGDEFLRLREASSQATRGRGKILDQKL